MKAFLKRAWPWFVGLAIIAVLATRVPFAAFGKAIQQGPHIQLAVVDLLIIIVLLAADSVATWLCLIAVRLRWSMRDVFAVRGATYVLALLNYAVGQGGLAYYLRKSGVSTARSAGVTLFMMGTTFATFLLTTTITWLIGVDRDTNITMWWTLVGGSLAFGVYLLVVRMAPPVLARRELFAPLFEARVRGTLLAIVGRLPHVALIVLGHWVAMLVWGFPVPFLYAAVVLPAVVIVSVLPISPGGLGTTQATLVYFFASYAAGATDEARSASILAFAIAHFVYATIAQLVVGVACIPLARRVSPVQTVSAACAPSR